MNTLPRFVFFLIGIAGIYLMYRPSVTRIKRLYNKFMDKFIRRGPEMRQKETEEQIFKKKVTVKTNE